ncbi:hypothetical protein ABRT01_18150, partial [Lentibacillus sp. L22]|uniref:hypothetical protein n=1 Tax=Lentibacillus sp. L22 TaxID=3163028 RepID=UPI00346796F1
EFPKVLYQIKVRCHFYSAKVELLFSFLLLTVITVIASNIPKLFEENEVGLVEDAYTSKGLYFGPQYYVHLSNGNIQRIFKNDFL